MVTGKEAFVTSLVKTLAFLTDLSDNIDVSFVEFLQQPLPVKGFKAHLADPAEIFLMGKS